MHSGLAAVFPSEPAGLVSCPLDSPSPLIPELCIVLAQASGTLNSTIPYHTLIQSHQVFFRRHLYLIPSTSHVIQRLTQSLSSLHSTFPNHFSPLFLIIKLTGSNRDSFEFSTSLSVVQFNSTRPSNHIHYTAR